MSFNLNLSSNEEAAIKIVSPLKFHRLFTLPATGDHGTLKISYSIAGPEDEDVPTILFIGGMFCTRWLNIEYEHLAQQEGVRILSFDRPSFGGSTPVPLKDRIPIFLETIPLLLHHLGIPHISIISHSSGTLFALNLLSTHPSLLSPSNPSITLMSPWVHQSHTSVFSLKLASNLPNPLFNHWDDIMGFILNRIQPKLGNSSGALSSMAGLWKGKKGEKVSREEEETRCREECGMSVDVKRKLEKLTMKYVFEENTKGANDEARLCLKSTEGCGWGTCENYPEFVRDLKDSWERRVDGGEGQLKVRIIMPEEDAMVGEKGKEYFKNCWTQEKCGRGIDVGCVEIKVGDHDNILNPEKGLLGPIFKAAKGGSCITLRCPDGW